MKTVTGLFDNYSDAKAAVSQLEAAGVPSDQVSIVSHRADGDHDDSNAAEGAGTGAGIGAVAGGAGGLLTGLGMLAIPGLGPIVAAGWLVSTLVGAGAGAAIGGLAGSLTHAGVDERDAHLYAEGVRRGGALVSVRADDTDFERIADILDDEGRVDLHERKDSWRSEGWSGPPIGAAASTTTGLTTGMSPTGFSSGTGETLTNIEVEDERPVTRATGTDPDRL